MCSARSVQGGGLPAEGGLAGLAARQAGQDPRVIQIAWRAQRRLHARWTHLSERRGRRTVPIPSVLRGHLVEQRIRTAPSSRNRLTDHLRACRRRAQARSERPVL